MVCMIMFSFQLFCFPLLTASFPVSLKVIKFLFFFLVLAFFQCYVCHASVTVEIDRGRISEPALCRNCNTNHSMVLIHNRSQYTDKQITKLQESPGFLSLLSFSYEFYVQFALMAKEHFL